MRTPVIVVAGQGDTDAAAAVLLQQPGTLVAAHRFDGHVVVRTLTIVRNGAPDTSEYVLELCHGCVSCTVRNDLLLLLRRLHRRDDVDRVVIHLADWLEPEPICWAINHVETSLGPGYVDGPAARDVRIAGVVSCLNASLWLDQALGEEVLGDGRTQAQVAVAQAESADVIVAPQSDRVTQAVLLRLAPHAWLLQDPAHVEEALAGLGIDARLGRAVDPLGPLLIGQPPLAAEGPVCVVEFAADRPFHPQRLHEAIDVLLSGVVRSRGRLWLASQPEAVMCLESAGGGLRVSSGGKWLAAMTATELARTDPQRRALAGMVWDDRHGDRHTSIVVVVCGGGVDEIRSTLGAALLTDAELSDPRAWADYDDPFGDWHQEPCGDSAHSETNPNADNQGGQK